MIIKTYKGGFKYLFRKYCGYATKSARPTVKSFENTKKINDLISISNLWSFRRDFLENIINK